MNSIIIVFFLCFHSNLSSHIKEISIKHYKVKSSIGSGGFARVFLFKSTEEKKSMLPKSQYSF